MSERTSNRNSGIGFSGLLTVVFITLKLTHYIAWSWWWVLAPMWGTAAFVLAIFIFLVLAFILKVLR